MSEGKTPPRGRLIVLEGGDGSGKSRLTRELERRLSDQRLAVEAVREPGSTPLGERIREIINSESAVDDALAELLLFEAARAHLVARLIEPALAAGTHVLCDRFTASSVAYQSYGRGLPRAVVERANTLATGALTPDLTLLLDLPPAVGLARRHADGRLSHFDALPLDFHERVRAGYLDLAAESAERWRVIDATQPFEAVLEDAWGALRAVVA
ncbi:MAG: dTMP kinase [Dehalococcoidia bacterium]|nr:dTMP kinase [Dehalococcoidia bacterium]